MILLISTVISIGMLSFAICYNTKQACKVIRKQNEEIAQLKNDVYKLKIRHGMKGE